MKCRKDEVLFHQGDIADYMYEIVSGQVGIFMDYDDEAQKEIGILSEGDFVGELELIDSSTRIASAVAMDNDVVVKRLTIDDFNDYVKQNPAKIVLIIQQVDVVVKFPNGPHGHELVFSEFPHVGGNLFDLRARFSEDMR